MRSSHDPGNVLGILKTKPYLFLLALALYMVKKMVSHFTLRVLVACLLCTILAAGSLRSSGMIRLYSNNISPLPLEASILS